MVQEGLFFGNKDPTLGQLAVELEFLPQTPHK